MSIKVTKQIFQKAILEYYNTLKKGYLFEVEKATNKTYAKKHFQQILFLENELVPFQTVFFDELKTTYIHHYFLDSKTAFDNTIDFLNQIKNISKNALNNVVEFNNGNKEVMLNDWYVFQMDTNQISLKHLIELENKVLESTTENIIGALAIYLAGLKLINEFENDNNKNSEEKENMNNKSIKDAFSFNQSEQCLALYFLMKSFGINLRLKSDVTKLSALYHLIMGVSFQSYKKLKDTNIYSKILIAPQVVKSDKTLLKYLNKIRPFFEDSNFTNVVEQIDKQIENCIKS